MRIMASLRTIIQWRQCTWRIVLIVMLSAASLSQAQENDPDQQRERLKNVQQQLKEQQSRFEQAKGAEQNLLSELHTIDQQLKDAQQKLDTYRQKVAQNEEELKRIQAKMEQLETQQQKTNTALSKRLRAIYKLGELGYLGPVLTLTSEADLQQQITYLQVVAESDLDLLQKAQSNAQAIRKEQDALQKRQQAILQAQQDVEQQASQIVAQKQQKTGILSKIRGDKQQFAKVLEELEVSAEKLDTFLQDLESQPKREPTGKNVGQDVTIPPNAQELVKAYGEHFRANKGKMLWPVQGKVITQFGNVQYDNTFTFYKGVDIQASAGTPFYAVFKGVVIFAGWFEGYGNLVIVDHGGNFYTLYAHADELLVKSGATVETRQILGKVGETDSIKGPLLYFEIRVNGKPENPQTWLAKVK